MVGMYSFAATFIDKLTFKMSIFNPEASDHAKDLEKDSNRVEETAHTSVSTDTDGLVATASPREIHGIKWAVVCVSIYISCLMYGLDMTIAADVQATIIVQFDSVDQLAWVGSGFLLGSVCSIFPM